MDWRKRLQRDGIAPFHNAKVQPSTMGREGEQRAGPQGTNRGSREAEGVLKSGEFSQFGIQLLVRSKNQAGDKELATLVLSHCQMSFTLLLFKKLTYFKE